MTKQVIRMVWVLLLGMALPTTVSADIFVSAAGANSVKRFDATTGAFKGDFVPAGSGGLGDPQGIAFGPDGNLYVSSNASNNVLKFDGQSGAFLGVFATVSGMTWPAEINFRDGFLYVSDFAATGRVSRFDAATGAFVDHFVTDALFADGQSWDNNGDMYVSSFGLNSIRKYDGASGLFLGEFVTSGSGGLNGPLDNIFLPNGEMLVSSFNTGSIKRYDATGAYIDDPITGLFGGPQGLEIGPDGLLYVGEFGAGIIRRYDVSTLNLVDTFIIAGSTTNNFTFSPESIPEPAQGAVLFGCLVVAWIRCRR